MILRFLAGLFDGHCKAEFWRMARELPVTQGVLASELFDKALDGTLRVTGQAGRLEFETEFGKGRMTKEYLDDGVRYSLDVPTFPPFSALFDARMEATVECSALVRLWDQLQVAATRRDLKLAA